MAQIYTGALGGLPWSILGGDCGQGTFDVEAEGIHLAFEDTNWIRYAFDWSNVD